MSNVLEAVDITKEYVDGETTLQVLQGISIAIAPGERIALVGRSGAGKSTLLHILAGLALPSAGEVRIADRSMTQGSPADRAAIRRELMGFVYQHHHLLPDFSALENVIIPQLIAEISPAKAEVTAIELLTTVGLEDRLNHRPSQLSGGERQRVALSRALATKPLLILADEPTGNLDKANESLVMELMASLCHDHDAALLMVTHDEDLASQADRVLYLDDGKLR